MQTMLPRLLPITLSWLFVLRPLRTLKPGLLVTKKNLLLLTPRLPTWKIEEILPLLTEIKLNLNLTMKLKDGRELLLLMKTILLNSKQNWMPSIDALGFSQLLTLMTTCSTEWIGDTE
jgi:hypothetical protein